MLFTRRKFRKLRRNLGGEEGYLHIERALSEALAHFHRQKPSKRLCTLVRELLASKQYLLTLTALEDAFVRASREGYFDNSDLYLLNDTIAWEILCYLSSEQSPTYYGNCLATLHFLDTYEFEPFFEKFSRVEQILRSTPDGIYAASTEETRAAYRKKIERYAKHRGIGEIEAAERLAGTPLREEHPFAKRAYFPLIALLTLLLTVGAILLAGGNFFPILLFLPFWELSRSLIDTIYAKCIFPLPLPCLSLSELPPEGETLAVITALLTGKEGDKALFERLERFWLQNQSKHLSFGILADFPDHSEAVDAGDEEILRAAMDGIRALNDRYGAHFFLFLRRREYDTSEQRYLGWERKRGAVLELVRLLRGEATTFLDTELPRGRLRSVRYLVTLDTDTDLAIGAINRMVGTMLHPENRPVIRDGAVREGHGLLQPRMETSLTAAGKTPFSLLECGRGGVELYSGAAFEVYQHLFGYGIFCGKGILDVDCYHTLLNHAFPKDRILSHDLLEGAYLRAGIMTDFTLTDSSPKTPLSAMTRSHRWIRGDTQALPFALPRVKNETGERVANPIPALSRFQLYDNLRRAMTPIRAAICLFIGMLLGGRVGWVLLLGTALSLFFPFLLSVATSLRFRSVARRFFSAVLPGMRNSFLRCCYRTASLMQDAVLASDAILRASWRMLFSKRHLLEWTTAAEGERRGNSLAVCYLRMALSTGLGIVFLLFSRLLVYRLLGGLWIVFPALAYLFGKPLSSPAEAPSATVKARLTEYAARMWQFYADLVTEREHFLPPDNLQTAPVAAIAHRTSPTNIGMYLLSALAARDFGLITSKELAERMEQTLSTVESLPKWHGHLYNWYDTTTAELIGAPYISTVDSGNLVTALIALKEGLYTYAEEEPALTALAQRAEGLAAEADFTRLYRKDRSLFCIGYDPVKDAFGESCYDLYMSEARTTGYYAIATGAVPKAHWSRLGRTLVGQDGYLGLVSWGGTAFEYFMPTLLLPVYANSLQAEALRFAFCMQEASTVKGVYGRSESGYFHFDADMNYQYGTFGVPKLGLKRGLEQENVIAPYASFLMLAQDPSALLGNLKRMEEKGAFGDYGFYEAIDFTPSRVGGGHAVIRSYMAHHVGMSMVAAANLCFENCFVKRFLQDPRMSAASELLMEKIPADAPLMRDPKRHLPPPARFHARALAEPLAETEAALPPPTFYQLSAGESRMLVHSEGYVGCSQGKRSLFVSDPTGSDPLLGLRFFCRTDETVENVLLGSYTSDNTRILCRRETPSAEIETSLSLFAEAPVWLFHLEITGNFRTVCPTLIFEPMLAREQDYRAHPAFSKLSITAKFDAERQILFFCRRPREKGEAPFLLGVAMRSEGAVDFSTQRDACLPLLYEESDLLSLVTRPLGRESGACIDPLCVLRRSSLTENGKYTCDFILTCADSEEEIVRRISLLRAEKRKDLLTLFRRSLRESAKSRLSAAGLRPSYGRYVSLLLAAMHRPIAHPPLTTRGEAAQLWQFGISGDLPIFLFEVRESPEEQENLRQILSGILHAQRYLALCGSRFDLVLLFEDEEAYRSPLKNGILDLVRECGSELFLGRRGGIFFVETHRAPEYLRASACFSATLDSTTLFDQLYYRYPKEALRPKPPLPAVRRPERIYTREMAESEAIKAGARDAAVPDGYFSDYGFTVLKGRQRAPYSYFYTGERFGTMLTQNSLGFTWYGSSREGRLTPFSNDPLRDHMGEQLLFSHEGKDYDLCAMASRVDFLFGNAVYHGTAAGIPFTVEVGVDERLAVKLIRVRIQATDAKVRLSTRWIMGADEKEGAFTKETVSGDTRFFCNLASANLHQTVGFVSTFTEDLATCFLLGAYPADSPAAYNVVREKYATADSFTPAFARYGEQARALCSKITVKTGDPLTDRMIGFYLPYQAIYVRMLARTGFYQPGGAFGFRDQLQDSLSALYCDPAITRRQILLAASRQYTEGDVLHWWHEEPVLRGVRTKCSDDLLWLPFCVSQYITHTGDAAILGCEVGYLESAPLGKEKERYETPAPSAVREHLYGHCMRAIRRALKLGIHRLPLMGSGDWNDGMNRVGGEGKGESVWLALFALLVIRSFLPIAESREDLAGADALRSSAAYLRDALERYGFSEDRYLRAFYDDGTPLGKAGDPECEIDLMPQAFSAIVFGKTERTRLAMDTAYRLLYDKQSRILRLFTPPFDQGEKDPGYLKGYAPGLRENGGQYTHAALFFVWGLYEIGKAEKAWELLSDLNPARRVLRPAIGERYRIEPYALAGDISASPEHPGRGGWSHYTGAAGWYYRIFLRETLGLRIYGDRFTLSPRLTDGMPKVEITLSLAGTFYAISAQQGEHSRTLLDGHAASAPFPLDGKSHFLVLSVAKPEKG